MAVAITLTAGAGFTGATVAQKTNPQDVAGVVTFTTATTIPGPGPYLLFTLKWAGSFATPYTSGPTVLVGAFANYKNARTAAQMQACASLGPFFVIPDSRNVGFDVYCTNAPAVSTAYEIGYVAIQGP